MRFFVACLLAAAGGSLVFACSSSDGGAPADDGGKPPVQVPASDATPDAPPVDADAGPSGGMDLSSTPKGLYEAEDQIAVAADGTIGVLWSAVGFGSQKMIYRFSSDDGATFSQPGAIAFTTDLFAGDPAIVADAEGNFWAAFLGIHYAGQTVDYARVFVAKAPKGSTTFGPPLEVSDPATTKFHDHPKIFVTKAGTIVVAFMESDSLTSPTAIGVAATSKNGADFTRHTLVGQPDVRFANLFSMCEGTEGTAGTGALYASFFQVTGTGYGVALRKSADEGTTWSASTVVSLDTETPAGLDMRCAAKGRDVWVGYSLTDSPAGNETTLDGANAIVVAHSANGGASFAERTNALDTKATALACLPELVREDDGALDVAYVAGAKDGDSSGTVRFTRAAGGGAFGPSTEVDGPLRFDLSRVKQTWLGDYFGVVAHGHALYLAYPRNETGHTHIFFKKVPLP